MTMPGREPGPEVAEIAQALADAEANRIEDVALSTMDLDAFLEGEEPPWDEDPTPPPDLERANAMLGRLRRLRAENDADIAVASRQIEQVHAWLNRREGSRRLQIDWLRASLVAYHQGVFARQGHASISLPNGTLKSKKGQPAWTYTDEAAFMAWAKENMPALVRQPPQPPRPPEAIDKNEVKKELTKRDEKGKPLEYGVTPDGERPPGLTVIPGAREYDVIIGGDSAE